MMDTDGTAGKAPRKSRARWGDGSCYLIGKKYYVSLSVDGKQMTRSTGLGLKDKKAALEMLKDWRRGGRQGLPPTAGAAGTAIKDRVCPVRGCHRARRVRTPRHLNWRLARPPPAAVR